jgi:hypothetical protein
MTQLKELKSFFEKETAPFKITFDSKYEWVPYIICGATLFAAYLLGVTFVAVILNITLYP